jgi:hypothetical protein
VIALGTDERGEPSNVSIMHRGLVGGFSGNSLAVAAPTILEADLAAKLLIIEGKAALARFDDRFKAVVTDREDRTELLVA